MILTFTKHGVAIINTEEEASSGGKGIGVPIRSEEERKLTWMCETRVRLFMQMELVAYRDEFG